MGLKGIIISIILIGVFLLAFTNFAILLAYNNSPSQSISQDTNLIDTAEGVNSGLLETYNNSDIAFNALSNSSITLSGEAGITLDSLAGTWRLVWKSPQILYDLTIGYVSETLFSGQTITGIPIISGSVIITIIGALILLTLMFAVWKAYQTGDPE